VAGDELGGEGMREAFLNTRMAPFNNLLARKAVNFAVDRRAAMAPVAQQPEARTITCQPIQPGMVGYRPYCPYAANPNAAGTWTGPNVPLARELVRESGPSGDKVEVWAPPKSWIGEPSADYIAQVLTRIGYRATVYRPAKTFADYVNAISQGHAQTGVIGDSVATNYGGDVIGEFLCSAENFDRYCDPHFDAQYRRGLVIGLTDPQRARDLWTTLDHELTDRAVTVPIWAETNLAYMSTRVGNGSTNAGAGILIDQLWVR
jgi:peptide/nickel transport system substrate-binding protein